MSKYPQCVVCHDSFQDIRALNRHFNPNGNCPNRRGMKTEAVFPLRPLEDLVFVKRSAADKKVGSIFLPDTNNDSPKTSGVIMAVGPGKFSEVLGRVIRPQIDVGQKVVFSRHANMAIDIEGIIPKDGEEYLVMHADELIAVITGDCGATVAPEPAPKVRVVN